MRLNIFLVEDSAVIRESLTAALEELAPVVVVGFAEDEQLACDWLAANSHDIDLVVIDMFLKTGSGLGVLRMAATIGTMQKVILSNSATDDLRRRCLAIGADSVFDKSNEFDEFLEYCRNLADGDCCVGAKASAQESERPVDPAAL